MCKPILACVNVRFLILFATLSTVTNTSRTCSAWFHTFTALNLVKMPFTREMLFLCRFWTSSKTKSGSTCFSLAQLGFPPRPRLPSETKRSPGRRAGAAGRRLRAVRALRAHGAGGLGALGLPAAAPGRAGSVAKKQGVGVNGGENRGGGGGGGGG